MGGGVDAASQVANVVLMGDRVSQVADALQLSQVTFSKIQQNLVWAFAYNVVAIPLAAGLLLPTMGLALTPSLSGACVLERVCLSAPWPCRGNDGAELPGSDGQLADAAAVQRAQGGGVASATTGWHPRKERRWEPHS